MDDFNSLPPIHFNCRCEISNSEMSWTARYGLQIALPETIIIKEIREPLTARVELAVNGIIDGAINS